MFSLNLRVLASAEDGNYPIVVSGKNPTAVKLANGADAAVTSTAGRVILEGSHNTLLALSGTVSFSAGDRELTSAGQLTGGSELTANIELDAVEDSAGARVNVYLVTYSRQGAMASLDCWETEVSGVATAFMQTVRIPRDVDIGAVKIIIVSDDFIPLMASGLGA